MKKNTWRELPTKGERRGRTRITSLRLRDLILAELIGALISGVIGGLVHLAFNEFHLERKLENICDILSEKDQPGCKEALDSIMDAAQKNIDNYTVNVE